jgi:type II secretory pathway component PulC
VAKGKEKKKVAIDRWLLGISLVLTFVVISIAIYLITFVGNQLLKAFVPIADETPQVQFDFTGYEALSESLKKQ